MSNEEKVNKIKAILSDKKTEFEARFVGQNGKKIELHSKQEVDEILEKIEKAKFIVKEIKRGEKKRKQRNFSI